MDSPLRWIPNWVQNSTRRTLSADGFAGFTNAALVLPQAIAFAAIAGLPPEYGIYSAITIPVVAALFGSSWHLVSGPTTAISAVVLATLTIHYEPLTPEFIAAALVLTLLAGLFQLGFGIARLGQLLTLVSPSVITGFTVGVALIIAFGQLQHLLGTEIPSIRNLGEFTASVGHSVNHINLDAFAIGMTTLVAGVVSRKINPLLPAYLIALLFGGTLGWMLDARGSGVEFITAISTIIPPLSFPVIDLESLRQLTAGAFVIALIGVLEATSIASAIAMKSRQDLDANREILAQGLSNVVGSFLSSYVGSGSFTRSGLNYEAGARSPFSAIFSSFFLVAILLFTSDFIQMIPVPAMAGLILLVAARLISIREISEIAKASRSELGVLVITLAAVLFVNIEFAIYAGVIVSLGVFINRTMRPKLVINAPVDSGGHRVFANIDDSPSAECPQLAITRINGPLFFGATDGLRREFRKLEKMRPKQKYMLIRIGGSAGMDFAGARLLVDEAHRRTDRGGQLFLAIKHPPLRKLLAQFRLSREIGVGHIYRHKWDALQKIVPSLDQSICATCDKRVFLECPSQEGEESTAPKPLEGDS